MSQADASVGSKSHLRGSARMEDVLRAGADPRLIGTMIAPLMGVLPGARAAAAALAGFVALEVVAFLGISALARAALAGAASGEIPGTSMVVAGLVAAAALFAVVTLRFARQEALIARWRGHLFDRLSRHIATARYEDLAGVPMAGLREILLTDAPAATRFYVEVFAAGLVVVFWMLGLGAVLMWRGSALALGLLLLLATFGVVLGVLMMWQMALTGPRFRRQSDLSERARDMCELDRAMALRQYGLAETQRERLLSDERALSDVLTRQAVLAQTGRAALLALNGSGFLLLAVLGAHLIAAERLTTADLFAVLFLTMQLFAALTQLGQMTGQAAETMTALRRLALYFDPPARAALAADVPVDLIEARGVSFGYRGQRPVIRGLDLRLERGITALTGRTGAGKTTLALLLSGLLEPDAGDVRLDGGTPAAALAPGRILYVGSKPVLFAGSLRDNLFAEAHRIEDDPSIDTLRRLLRQEDGAAIGLDDPLVGPGGAGLSSGQGQIVGLMRAILRGPDAILLDEATSSLDMGTEADVQRLLLAWCRARVTLVVSHRPCPWVAQADRSLEW